MGDMDLVPSEFRKERMVRRSLGRFIWAIVLLLGLVAAARATLGYLIWREQAQVVRLEQRQLAYSQTQTRADSLRQQRMVTQQQLSTLEQLQGADRVEQFLRSIDDAYSEHIWLDGVHFQRRENTGAPADVAATPAAGNPGSEPGAIGVTVFHDAEIIGHASSHSELATFMQRLGAQPAVADLRLINTATRSYTNVQVIDFKLALQMRGKERP
jgi:Fimbrial assembly protein (PilN)